MDEKLISALVGAVVASTLFIGKATYDYFFSYLPLYNKSRRDAIIEVLTSLFMLKASRESYYLNQDKADKITKMFLKNHAELKSCVEDIEKLQGLNGPFKDLLDAKYKFLEAEYRSSDNFAHISISEAGKSGVNLMEAFARCETQVLVSTSVFNSEGARDRILSENISNCLEILRGEFPTSPEDMDRFNVSLNSIKSELKAFF